MITRVMQTQTEKTSRAAGRWVWVSRTIFAVLILAVLVFGFFLAAANVAQRQELSEMSDRLAGADGQPGAPGANGSDGRGISTISCVLNDDLSTAFRFTFTDGTTTDVPGACLP